MKTAYTGFIKNINFLQDTLDFVGYIAKDANDLRACYVLECGGGLAKDVISTIGQAFELRFQQFTNKSPIVYVMYFFFFNLVFTIILSV